MTLRNRFSLIAVGITIFIIATPILVLFASGFKIDWQNRTIVKTGTFMAKTKPEGATVYINNKAQDDLTPSIIRFVLPGDYNIRIEKEGFQSWTKRLSVRAQLVTWAHFEREFITLFYEQAKQLDQSPAEKFAFNRDLTQAVFSEGSSIKFADLTNHKTESIGQANPNWPDLLAAQVEFTDAGPVYDKLKNFSFNLTDSQIKSVRKISSNADYTIVHIADQLYLAGAAGISIIDKNVLAYQLQGQNVWYIKSDQLIAKNLKTGETQIASKIPISQTAEIFRTNELVFLILDNALYSLNGELKKIHESAAFASWDAKAKLLLFGNTNEIMIFRPDAQNTELILRSLSAISQAQLNQETGYVFFANEGKIKAIELDGRDHRNIYQISELPEGHRFAASPDGTRVYIFGAGKLTVNEIR